MSSPKSIGRKVGLLLLIHLAIGLMLPYILLKPALAPPGFLENAAANAGVMRLVVFLFFAAGSLTVGIALAGLPVFCRYSEALARWFVALSIVNFSLQVVESGAVLSMLSLSQEYAQAGAANPQLFETLGAVVGAARKWAHYTQLLVVVGWLFLMYGILFRFALVPRLLAVLGLIGTLLQITGVTLRGLLGYPPMTVLAMPLAPIHFALTMWLLAKGFKEEPGFFPHATT